jgi:hypothetical protein
MPFITQFLIVPLASELQWFFIVVVLFEKHFHFMSTEGILPAEKRKKPAQSNYDVNI